MSENFADWQHPYLNDLCSKITDGAHYSPATDEDGLPIATVENMLNSRFDIASCRRISRIDFEDLKRNNCQPQVGDVLFSKDGTIGKTFVYNQNTEVVLLSSIAIIRTKNEQLDPEYCSLFLESPTFFTQLETKKSGLALKRVVLGDIKKIKVPLPSLIEQKKIAEILTSVDKVIELTELEIEKLKNLKKGMMQDLLTKGIGHTKFKDSPIGKIPESWKFVSLKECLKVSSGSGLSQKDMIDGPYKVYGGNGVNGKHNEMTEARSRLIIGRVGAHCGNVHITEPNSWITDNALIVTLLNSSDHNFWYHKLSYLGLNNLAYTGAQPVITGGIIYPLKVAVPSDVNEEKAISIRLASVDKVIKSKEEKLNKSKIMKKGLMQDLLTGKVRVKV